MEPGPAARGPKAKAGVGQVTKDMVVMGTAIAAALVVGGVCSTVAS